MKNRLTLTSCRYTRDWEKTLTFTGTIWAPGPLRGDGDILNKRLLSAKPMVVTTNPLPVSYAKGS